MATQLKQKVRLNYKKEAVDCKVSNLMGFFLILLKEGSLLIIDQTGSFISSIQSKSINFSAFYISDDIAYFGSEEGQIFSYKMSSLQLMDQQ